MKFRKTIKQGFYLFCLISLLGCNTQRSKVIGISYKIVGIEQEVLKNRDTYSFSFSRTGNIDVKNDKFHHIRIISDDKVNRTNINEVKAAILNHPTTQKMLDSLNYEIQKLGLDDSTSANISVEFNDHVKYYCQVHHEVCIFRNYRFVQSKNGKQHRLDDVEWGELFVDGMPISRYPIDSVIKVLGTPDSIVSGSWFSEGEGKYDRYYFSNSTFNIDEGSETCYVESIDLSSRNIQIDLNGHIFNKNTTLDEFKKIYP